MKIGEIFKADINRDINPVIKVADQNEEQLRDELDSYVITEVIERDLEDFLNHYAETRLKETDHIGAWLYGFVGAGKSHLAKIVGLLLANPNVAGQSSIDRFIPRIQTCKRPREIERLLFEIRNNIVTEVIPFHINSEANQAAEDNICRIFYRVFFRHLGFSEDIRIASIEQTLVRAGKIDAFKSAVNTKTDEDWETVRRPDYWDLYRQEIFATLAEILPASYSSPEDAQIAFEGKLPLVTFRNFAERVEEYVAEREKKDKGKTHRVLFIVDELGTGRKFINRKKIVFGNLVNFLAQKQWKYLTEDTDFMQILDAGFRSFIFYPVIREDRVCASVSLFSTSENAFDRSHVELVRDLPLGKALLTAFYYEENEDLKFRLDLIRKISSASNNIREAAKVIVNELANNYHWQNVSLFRVDEERGLFSLVRQKASSKALRFPKKDYKQPLDEGILGYVYRNRVGVNIGNVNTDPKFKDIFKATVKGIVSELSLPIIIDDKVCWILNIEDSHQNAFSEEEKNALEGVLAEVGEFLQRSWLHHFLKATLEYASDAVVVTDSKGNINRVNPATQNLLGYSEKSMIGSALKGYFKDADVAEDVLKVERIPSEKVSLQGKKGDEINVLLSASQLPEDVGGKVFIAKDLTLHNRMEELEYLEKMYYEIATQTKTPLSLVFTWIGRLGQEIKTDTGLDTIDHILRQLRKVELTFDRLALYDKERGVAPPRPFLLSIKEVVDRVREDIPKRDRDKIKVDQEGPWPLVRGDLYQLFFSFQSILSYLLRFLPEEDIIRWTIRREDDRVVSEINGYFPSRTNEKPDDLEEAYLLSRTLAEMAMGKAFIKGFIDQHHGTFVDPRVEDETMTFRIELPIAQGY